jgi:hypothetical protein
LPPAASPTRFTPATSWKDTPKNKGDNLMLPVTGLPDDLPTYIDYSMIAQVVPNAGILQMYETLGCEIAATCKFASYAKGE